MFGGPKAVSPAFDAPKRTGADVITMSGYLRGRLTDDEGAAGLLATARETAQVGRPLGVARHNLPGAGLGEGTAGDAGGDRVRADAAQGARHVRLRGRPLSEKEGVTVTLENLDCPGVPFGRAENTLALVAAVEHLRLRLNVDLSHAQIGEGNLIGLCPGSVRSRWPTWQAAWSPARER